MPRDKSTAHTLRRFADAGIIDTVLAPFDERLLTVGYLKWFGTLALKKKHSQNNAFMNIASADQSQRFQSNRLSTVLHETVTDYWAVELARFVVPNGQIGFVTGVEQVVNAADGSYYPSNVAYWGSPRFVISDVDNIRWYLRLDYFNGLHPNRYNLSSTVAIPWHALPGEPYSDLHEIDAIWYPANNNRRLKLIVPAQRMLRFFMITPPTTLYQWEVSGRLTGYTQTAYTGAAVHNAREIT